MEHEISAAERMLLEAEFRARRERMLRAQAHVAAAATVGLGAVVVAKQAAPEAFDTAAACFALAILGSLLRVWWVARRHWHCPQCETRWEAKETLASFSWNHCPDCGAPLRAYPVQGEKERVAQAAFALDRRTPEELRVDFERRRRQGLWGAAVATVVGIFALVALSTHEVGEIVEQSVMAAFAALVVGSMLWATRCPRCQMGLLGSGRHCQRCGLRISSPPDDPAPPVPR